jgi:tetratricopeptide (TPR) repeat protein
MTSDNAKECFTRLQQAFPIAAECLSVAACLPVAIIPPEFFRLGAPALGPVLSKAFTDKPDDTAIENILRPLDDCSLWRRVTKCERFQGWKIEPAGEEAVKSSLDAAVQRLWSERVVKAADCYLRADKNGRIVYKEIALACAEAIKRWDLDFVEAGWPLLTAAYALGKGDNEKEVGIFLQRALRIFEKHLGPDHPEVAAALYELGKRQAKSLDKSDGTTAEAASHLARALQIRSKVLPVTSPVVLDNANTLAEVYLKRKELAAADKLVGMIMSTVLQRPKMSSAITARALHNRAWLLHLQGNHHEAIDAASQALRLRQMLDDEVSEHPTEEGTLEWGTKGDSYGLLSNICLALERFEESGRYRARQLAGTLKGLGFQPDEITGALVEVSEQRDTEQLPFRARLAMQEEAVDIVAEELGPHHPAAVPALERLAPVLFVRDGYNKAEPLFR